jgi:hypothetical protein
MRNEALIEFVKVMLTEGAKQPSIRCASCSNAAER